MGRSTPIKCKYTLSWNRSRCSNNIKDHIFWYFDLCYNWSRLNWCWEKHRNWKMLLCWILLIDTFCSPLLNWPAPAKLTKVPSRFCREIWVFSLVSSSAKSFSTNTEHCSIHCQWQQTISIFVIAWGALPQQINVHHFLFCHFFLSCCFIQLCDKPVSWHDW